MIAEQPMDEIESPGRLLEEQRYVKLHVAPYSQSAPACFYGYFARVDYTK